MIEQRCKKDQFFPAMPGRSWDQQIHINQYYQLKYFPELCIVYQGQQLICTLSLSGVAEYFYTVMEERERKLIALGI